MLSLQEIFKALGEGKTIVSVPNGDYSISIKDNELFIADGVGRGIIKSCGWQIKKPTITINGIELVAPEREPLQDGDRYYRLAFNEINSIIWDGGNIDNGYMEKGQIFLTKKDAEAMRDALKKLLTGQ